MPFQSEKQRRYLWANEPEIARDWTDTYGSGIAKALGGRIPFQQGKDVWNIKYGTDQTLREHGDQGWVGGPLKEYNPALDLNKPYRLAMNEYLKSNQPISYSEAETIPNPDYFGLNIGRNYIPTEEIPLQVGPYEGERYSIKDMRGIGGLEQLIGDDDDEPGTIAFDPNNPQVNRSMFFNPYSALGIGALKGGVALKNYLRNMFISKVAGKPISKYTKPFLKRQMMKFAGIDPRARMPFKHKDQGYQYDPTLRTVFKEEIGGAESKIKPPTRKTYVSPARPHGGGGGGGQPGSMPTGTAGQNPWGRAKGGLAGLWQK